MKDSSNNNPVIDLHKARDIILKMISSDMATFEVMVAENHREEYIEVTVEYEVCGVHYEKDEGVLKIIVNVNKKNPAEVPVNTDKFYDEVEKNISERMPFLLKGTYYISLDKKSVNDIQKTSMLKAFKEELIHVIERRGFSKDEVLPVIMEYVKESMTGSTFQSVDDITKPKRKKKNPRDRPIIEITPPGEPCPHCNGLLSERKLRDMLMRFYMKYCDDDGCDY